MTKICGGVSVLVIAGLVVLMLLSAAIPASMPVTHPVDELSLWATSIMLDCDKAATATDYVLGYIVRGHGPVQARAHASDKHGHIVLQARVEFGRRGPDKWQECKLSDRILYAIQMDANTWCVMIKGLTSGLELTCFDVRTSDFGRRWRKLLEMHDCYDDGNARRAW